MNRTLTLALVAIAISSGIARAATPKDGLISFGATSASWNQHHRVDTREPIQGYAYDPTPSLGSDRYNDRYFQLIRYSGRVLDYTMRFESRTSIDAAKTYVLKHEFTPDAKVLWFKRHGSMCAEMLVHSNTLKKATKESAIVVFNSGADGLSYNSASITFVVLAPTSEPFTGLDC
jgi:hypothetical protein